MKQNFKPFNKNFRKFIENFECENCKNYIKGNGYTNHCNECLYSKHVDINPGDRQNNCGGMMKPIEYFIKKDCYIVKHKCIKCNSTKNNKLSKSDNINKLFEISPMHNC